MALNPPSTPRWPRDARAACAFTFDLDAETLWMASELPKATLQEVLVSPVLSHLDLDGAKPDVWDQWRLVHFFALVMNATERK